MKLSARTAVLAATTAAALIGAAPALGATGGDLETYTSGQGLSNLEVPMAAGSSPSITYTSGTSGTNPGAEIAYENTAGTVSANGSGAGATLYNVPVEAGTSPAIAALGTYNDFEIAVNSGNRLMTMGAGQAATALTNTGINMQPGSSPGIGEDSNGWEAVVSSPSGELYGYGTATDNAAADLDQAA